MKISKKDINLIKFIEYNNNQYFANQLTKKVKWRNKILKLHMHIRPSKKHLDFWGFKAINGESKEISENGKVFYILPFVKNLPSRRFTLVSFWNDFAFLTQDDINWIKRNIDKILKA